MVVGRPLGGVHLIVNARLGLIVLRVGLGPIGFGVAIGFVRVERSQQSATEARQASTLFAGEFAHELDDCRSAGRCGAAKHDGSRVGEVNRDEASVGGMPFASHQLARLQRVDDCGHLRFASTKRLREFLLMDRPTSRDRIKDTELRCRQPKRVHCRFDPRRSKTGGSLQTAIRIKCATPFLIALSAHCPVIERSCRHRRALQPGVIAKSTDLAACGA